MISTPSSSTMDATSSSSASASTPTPRSHRGRATSRLPILFASDVGQKVGKLYGSTRGGIDNRNLFVIDPAGRIAHRMLPFNELSAAAYDELEEAVKKTLPAH